MSGQATRPDPRRRVDADRSRTAREDLGRCARVQRQFPGDVRPFVYGYCAVYIARTFFPTGDPFSSLMLSLGTFAAGFLMRPLDGLILGSYIDRKGRRVGRILTLGLMAVGTSRFCISRRATV